MAHFGFPLETIIVFFGVIALSVYLDLFVHRNSKEISVKDAALWSVFWIGLALCFYVYLWVRFDAEWADLYLAGYVLEKSLSIDNLMVFVAIFASFGITGKLQHRILYWGIIGALIFRGLFVGIGTWLFALAPWVGFVFAAVVIWSGWKMLKSGNDEEEIEDYSNHRSVRLTGKLMPIYTKLFGERFFVKHSEMNTEQIASTTRQGLKYVTPAFLCLMAIETSDVAFALDSVPAVIAVTQEPLLVYAAMIFAILGLRSLYFILVALTKYLVHLEKAVIVLLFFIAAKIVLQSFNHWIDTGFHISPNTSLFIVLGVLAIGVIASFIFPEKETQE
ncbi:TerC/Alx family metal homeostasis membrane protein [Glaesserella parasuis]|uniref:TerC/Alx family metal homeostasis membrane protein n=1 Tax=Glaesserella parasuis TaxID=738 RepID=UPI00136534D9|nr:TerC/Alx family metal homeostasis membrane protein [Glaesserella parasuis]MCT8823905.1 TerC/Alx family metal homeostasis membrane protein [Glaesserella parasuis]MDG6409876.1 TerC/Alx family metal homeostasis membrane protein [Glaesserella parasuis]MDG6450618.1 TerC/Alx family metal homeostasis membrane protein [Glaesserella parasuis]MDO9780992.1 TerC/Alx family metal homeostasis membrane protein [Glaesserella parasuis]MDO9791669.1 TerC/Alx family metal homeostasis membrane protein [Glaesser